MLRDLFEQQHGVSDPRTIALAALALGSSPDPDALAVALPKAAASILRRTLDVLQDADEIWGGVERVDYVPLMDALIANVARRRAACLASEEPPFRAARAAGHEEGERFADTVLRSRSAVYTYEDSRAIVAEYLGPDESIIPPDDAAEAADESDFTPETEFLPGEPEHQAFVKAFIAGARREFIAHGDE